MKKILSVFLAMLMLFGALSISSSAATEFTAPDLQEAINATKARYGANSMYLDGNDDGYVIISYSIGVGEYMYEVPVYDTTTKSFVKTLTPGDPYFEIPEHKGENYISYGNYKLPYVRDTEEKQFIGWTCSANHRTYTAGATIQLTSDMVTSDSGIIYFTAEYLSVVPQSDVLETIINVLVKVFGSIIGFVFFAGDPDEGVNFMNGLIGGILEGI